MSALQEVRDRGAAAAVRVGRHPDEITLVAVSKGAGDDAVANAYAVGARDFGENRAGAPLDRAPRPAGHPPGPPAPGWGMGVRGLMPVAPRGPPGGAPRPYFAALRDLRDRLLPTHPGLR